MTYPSQLTPERRPRITVGFLGFDGMTTLDLTGPLEAFSIAHLPPEEGNAACYERVLVGLTGKTFVARSGATFKAQHTIRTAPHLDTIIVPGGAGMRESDTSRLIADWLLERAQSARRIASVSTGIYPLAQSGLLDGRRVTTHWRYAQQLAGAFRRLQVDEAASFIKDDRFYTCGGGTAGIEMSLALIQEDYGARTALSVARELVVNLRPAGGGERLVDPAPNQAGTEERLAELPGWIISRLQQNLSVEVLAERACLCPRHFTRLFKRTFRRTPANFVEQLRITEAAHRLASRNLSIGGVADSVGFKSPEVFRRAFERRFGVTPTAFQKRIRANAQASMSLRRDLRQLGRTA